MTTGLQSDLYVCPVCERPLAQEGIIMKRKAKGKPARPYRVLECGHHVPMNEEPVFRRDPHARKSA